MTRSSPRFSPTPPSAHTAPEIERRLAFRFSSHRSWHQCALSNWTTSALRGVPSRHRPPPEALPIEPLDCRPHLGFPSSVHWQRSLWPSLFRGVLPRPSEYDESPSLHSYRSLCQKHISFSSLLSTRRGLQFVFIGLWLRRILHRLHGIHLGLNPSVHRHPWFRGARWRSWFLGRFQMGQSFFYQR